MNRRKEKLFMALRIGRGCETCERLHDIYILGCIPFCLLLQLLLENTGWLFLLPPPFVKEIKNANMCQLELAMRLQIIQFHVDMRIMDICMWFYADMRLYKRMCIFSKSA